MATPGLQVDFRVFESFFDRAHVQRAMDKKRQKGLSKAGAFVRTRARSSIRRRKKSAPPGQPPSSHTGELKGNIFFAYDDRHDTVFVGPIKLPGKKGDAPGDLEHGSNPFMQPALETEAPNFPGFIANA